MGYESAVIKGFEKSPDLLRLVMFLVTVDRLQFYGKPIVVTDKEK